MHTTYLLQATPNNGFKKVRSSIDFASAPGQQRSWIVSSLRDTEMHGNGLSLRARQSPARELDTAWGFAYFRYTLQAFFWRDYHCRVSFRVLRSRVTSCSQLAVARLRYWLSGFASILGILDDLFLSRTTQKPQSFLCSCLRRSRLAWLFFIPGRTKKTYSRAHAFNTVWSFPWFI